MSGLDFRLVNLGRDYRLEPTSEKGRAYVEALPASVPRPVEIEHDGWLPLCMALEREGFSVRIIDRE